MSDSPLQTMLHGLLHWERTQPDATYLTQPLADGRVEDYAWGEVARQVRAMAAHLRARDLPPNSSIAVLGRNSAHWLMADLAILMAGHVSVPLYPTLNAETAAYILDHAGVRLLMLGKMDGIADSWHEVAPALPAQMPVIALPMAPPHAGDDLRRWDDLVAGTAPIGDAVLPRSNDLATIVYTSGSTGRPKGVMHSFGSSSTIRHSGAMFWAGPQDRMLSYLPLSHVAERSCVEMASLMFGFRVFFSDSLESFPRDLQRARPTVFFSVPRLWTKFYQAVDGGLSPAQRRLLASAAPPAAALKKRILAQLGLDHCRIAVTGSAPLTPAIIDWYRNLGLEMLDAYGMSEDFGYSHAGRPGEARVGTVGAPMPGVECRIVESGEIQIRSPGLMLGYHRQPELVAETLTHDGFLRTGDRGEVDATGRLRITGRIKELFKPGKGKYVAPVPIENRLAAHGAIETVCVTGPGQPQPFALLVLCEEARRALAAGQLPREQLSGEFAELLQGVNRSLEDHEKLDYLVVIGDTWTAENGLLTPTLKIRRGVIEDRYLPYADGWRARKAAVIWQASTVE